MAYQSVSQSDFVKKNPAIAQKKQFEAKLTTPISNNYLKKV